ncbi:MAG: helix-turn-helix transcriptional regulator [Promethearchaeota archaeon]
MKKSFQYKGKPVKLSTHEFITLLKIRMSTPHGISGYKLISELAKIFAGSWSPQSGTIYPILRRLVEQKGLIKEREEKTPIGPSAKVYHVRDDVKKLIDNIVLANYKQDLKFFANYIQFLASNFDKSVKAGLMPGEVGIEFGEEIDEMIKKLEDVKKKMSELVDMGARLESKCSKCGALLPSLANFCPACGAKLIAQDEKEKQKQR